MYHCHMESGQTIGRETFGYILVILGIVCAVCVPLTMYFFAEDSGLFVFLPLIPNLLVVVFGILIVKGMILKQLKTNAEIAAERGKR